MDSTAFDGLVRVLGGSASRRSMMQMIGGLSLGAITLIPKTSEAKQRKRNGKGKKVTICHQGQTLSVAKPALKGHLKHGDTLGACPGQETPGGDATCTDGVTNGTETDVDCGGGTCPRCATGKICSTRDDCATARCTAGTCQTCQNANTDCGTDANGGMCACRDHESGQRFCTKINGGAGGIECILPCGA